MFGKNKTPQKRILEADKKRQKLRTKRAKLDEKDPNYEKKKWKLNNKIHTENKKEEVAKMELQKPVQNSKTFAPTLNVSKSSKETHGHFHYHNHKSSRKK